MAIATLIEEKFNLEDFIANPPENQEWVNGQLMEKTGMTIKHSEIEATLVSDWKNYIKESGQGGKAYVELPCRTLRQGRRPDVCYLTSELVAEFGNAPTLPQSPPLIAEIASHSDFAEDLFAKADEYLESGCQEVWLVFPESRRILIITQNQTLAFHGDDIVTTQLVLTGFSVDLNELFG